MRHSAVPVCLRRHPEAPDGTRGAPAQTYRSRVLQNTALVCWNWALVIGLAASSLLHPLAPASSPPHRLVHTKYCKSDKCPLCGMAGANTEHVFWHCKALEGVRGEHVKRAETVIRRAQASSVWRRNVLKSIMDNSTFRNCGICPGDVQLAQEAR